MHSRYIGGVAVTLVCAGACLAQQADPSATEHEAKRVFGIIPNYRTAPSLEDAAPLTVGGKFKIAAQDSFDRGTVILAALSGGIGQLSDSNPSFGQGAAGYGRYFATSYAGFVIGNFMTEGIFPSMLHQDPRYFRRGTGSAWSRLGYAAGQIFVTHGDAKQTEFNASEIVGNSTAVAISTAYYPDHRNAPDAVQSLGTQLGIDMAANVLKEFWPDITRKLSHKHR